MRTPCDTTYIKDAQSPPPLTGRAAVLHVPNVMDLIPSIAARNMSLSLSTLSLSLRVRMKYRSVILVGKRKEKNRILSEMMGTTQVCLHRPQKSWEWRPMRVERRRTRRQLLRLHLSQEMRPALPKEEIEETLRRCSGKMLFISIMRERRQRTERVWSCVCLFFFFFYNQNPLAERKRRNGRECYGPRNPFGSFIYHNGASRRRKKKERKRNHNN